MFLALFLAQGASNVGSWMQAVGAQWLIGSLGGGAIAIALVQTATTAPITMLAVPAGALADVIDRRRLLIFGQFGSLASAGALAFLTSTGVATVAALLAFTSALGCFQALISPSWQAIQPELVGSGQVPAAMTLQAANTNVARAIGPALGGVVVASLGAEWTFWLNAFSFLGTAVMLAIWRRGTVPSAYGSEHLFSASRVGARYVRSAPALRRVLLRAALFLPAASALWALLPLVARGPLRLGSGGYGVLLGALGAGAVGGAMLLPRLTRRHGPNRVLAGASVIFAAGTAILASIRQPAVVFVFMLAAGVGWIGVLATLNITAQTVLPAWVRARAIGFYLVVFSGGQALGAVVWGVLAERAGLDAALYVASAAMLLGSATLMRLPLLKGAGALDTRISSQWPEPHLLIVPTETSGPVEINITYDVVDENAAQFANAMTFVRRSRLRTGAERWTLFQDGEQPTRWVETYRMASWAEHERQRHERITESDREQAERARALCRSAPEVRHLFSPFGPHGPLATPRSPEASS